MREGNPDQRLAIESLVRGYRYWLPYLELGCIRRGRVPSVSLLYSHHRGLCLLATNSRINLRIGHSEVRVMSRLLRVTGFDPRSFEGCILLTNNEPCWYCEGIMTEKGLDHLTVRSTVSRWAFGFMFKRVRNLLKIRIR